MRRSTLRLYCRKVSSMDKWKVLRIENSFGTDFINGQWTMCVEAQRAAPPSQRDRIKRQITQ